MMPTCAYKRCGRVAEKPLGTINIGLITGDKDGYGKVWSQPEYVCGKHLKKILGLLGYKEDPRPNKRNTN